MSRNHLTEWEDDLDACLLFSTQEMSGAGLEEFKDSSDLPPQLIETQQQLLKTVVEQSEREYLEKALEDSIKTATLGPYSIINDNVNNTSSGGNIGNNVSDDVDVEITEATLMDSVYQASLAVPNLNSEINNGLAGISTSFPTIVTPSHIVPPSTAMDPDVKLALELSQLNEDEILQRVLQESL